jgi:Tfp pilus assembly protein PilO
MKILISLFLVVAAVCGFFWYVEPAWAAIGSTKATITQYQTAVSQAQEAVTTKNTLVSEYNSFTQAQLAQLNQFLPQNVDPVTFILEINAIAAQYGGGLKSVSVGSPGSPTDSQGNSTDQSYSTLPLSITTAMTYPNFLLFLKDLEQSLPPTDITSLSFSPPSTGSIYSFNIGLQTYYLP